MGTEHGQVHWSELMTGDPLAAVAFYTAVLGLRVQEMAMGGPEPYRVLMRGDEPVGGILGMTGPGYEGVAPQWTTYFAVADADAAAAEAKAAGAALRAEPFDVPKVGRIVLITDPGGAMCGLIQPAADE